MVECDYFFFRFVFKLRGKEVEGVLVLCGRIRVIVGFGLFLGN